MTDTNDLVIASAAEFGKELAEPAKNLTNPICAAMGQTFADVWNIFFGHPLSFVSDIMKAKLSAIQNDFLSKLENETNKIPADKKLQEPDLAILMPTMEALRTNIADECARDMFAKLIANTLNSDMVQFVNKSYVEIIKQMSHLDALILKTFIKSREQPITKFIRYVDEKKETYSIIEKLVYIAPNDLPQADSIKPNAVSITNLQRLGLLSFEISSVGEILAEESVYDAHDLLLKQFTSQQKLEEMEIGKVSITPFGDGFIKSCL